MPRHVAAGTMLSYFPRRHRNVAFKILVIFAFVYLISIALDLRHSAVTQLLAPAAVNQDAEHLNIVRKPPDADIRDSKDDSEVEQPESAEEEVKEDIIEGEEEEDYDGPKPPPPVDPKAPGEMGKAYKVDKPSVAVKQAIDLGWKNNAYNQVSCDWWRAIT